MVAVFSDIPPTHPTKALPVPSPCPQADKGETPPPPSQLQVASYLTPSVYTNPSKDQASLRRGARSRELQYGLTGSHTCLLFLPNSLLDFWRSHTAVHNSPQDFLDLYT